MAEVKHTPGPWTFGRGFNGHGSVRDANGEAVAAVSLRGTPPMFKDTATADANARLIAAAPELLETARAVLREFGHREGDDDALLDPQPQELMRALQAAIAKAEGRA